MHRAWEEIYQNINDFSVWNYVFFLVLFCIFQIVMLGLLTFLIGKIKKTFSVLFLSETGAVVDPALLSVKILLWPSAGWGPGNVPRLSPR